jgi:hypothetical protein
MSLFSSLFVGICGACDDDEFFVLNARLVKLEFCWELLVTIVTGLSLGIDEVFAVDDDVAESWSFL